MNGVFRLSLGLLLVVCWLAGMPSSGFPQTSGLKSTDSQDMPVQKNQTQPPAAAQPILMNPVGRVVKKGDPAIIEILPQYIPALDGLAGFSHIWVLFWFHGNDTPENRAILKVHPRKDPANPLTGVFATRSPMRPNLIGMTCCRLVKVEGRRLTVAGLDAWEGTPIVDIKPYIPASDALPEAATPDWVKRRPKEGN